MSHDCEPTGNGGNSTITNQDEQKILDEAAAKMLSNMRQEGVLDPPVARP